MRGSSGKEERKARERNFQVGDIIKLENEEEVLNNLLYIISVEEDKEEPCQMDLAKAIGLFNRLRVYPAKIFSGRVCK